MSSVPAGTPPPGALSRINRIALTGFMGAGKSTVGSRLARRLGWKFLDLDILIERQHGLTVAEIFQRHGEARFRELELQALIAAMREDQAVIALGGGAIETPAVADLLFPDGSPGLVPAAVTIFLAAPLTELLARCHSGAHPPVRPLLSSPETPADRLTRSLPLYRRAHLTVNTSGITPDQVVNQILSTLPGMAPPAVS